MSATKTAEERAAKILGGSCEHVDITLICTECAAEAIREAELDALREAARAVCPACEKGAPFYALDDGTVFHMATECAANPIHALIAARTK